MSNIKDLYEAINNQSYETVKKLIGEDEIIKQINDYTAADLTPLAVALQNLAKPETKVKGELALQILTALLEVKELDVNQSVTPMRGDTPLIYAIDMGFDVKLLKPLLDRKDLDPNRVGQDRRTPLQHAMDVRDADLVKVLLEKGADPSIPDPSVQKKERSKLR